jgi:hypothetical protein
MRELCRGDTAKIASGQRRRRCEGEKQKRDHARGEQKQSSGEWQWAKQIVWRAVVCVSREKGIWALAKLHRASLVNFAKRMHHKRNLGF